MPLHFVSLRLLLCLLLALQVWEQLRALCDKRHVCQEARHAAQQDAVEA